MFSPSKPDTDRLFSILGRSDSLFSIRQSEVQTLNRTPGDSRERHWASLIRPEHLQSRVQFGRPVQCALCRHSPGTIKFILTSKLFSSLSFFLWRRTFAPSSRRGPGGSDLCHSREREIYERVYGTNCVIYFLFCCLPNCIDFSSPILIFLLMALIRRRGSLANKCAR